MQNNPPSRGEPDGTPSPAQNEQEDSTQQNLAQTYKEPAYQEYAPSGAPSEQVQQLSTPDQAAEQVATPSGPLAPVEQPGYAPPAPSPVYAPQPGSMQQPGYLPTTPQPGYVPATPQPGYVPQPGFVPATSPPGYLPPGYVPPVPPGVPPRRKWNGLAITGVVVAIIVVLAVVLGTISLALARSPSAQTTTTPTPKVTNSPPTAQTGHPTSAFQAATCPFRLGAGIVEGQQVSCGYVTVPENRTTNDGQQVKLAVAVFKAPQYMSSVDPDPVLRLDGGPGGPSLDNWAHYITASNYNTFIFHHDVIMFDQRGTGYSTPSLKCPELIALQDSSAAGGAQTYEQAAHTCYNRLVAQGIDLNGFNTLQNAADVADIIHALGYQQMTLYGVSYGTRLALTTMRLYPSVVHAVVLDSVYPPERNRDDLPSDAQRVFTVLFQGCAKDPTCKAKYPNLQTVFYNLVDQLNAHPITFGTQDFTTGQQYTVHFAGDDLISWVFSTLYATSLIPAIPQTIFQIKAHNYTQLSEIYGEIVFDDTFSDGMFYSAECSEDWPFLTQQNITASEKNITPQIAKVFGQEDEEQEYSICQFWKVQQVPAAQKQQVVSSIPTLIVTGEYDPITPPANGQEVEKTLSHSYFFEFPGQGHGQQYSSPCSDQIISAFYDNPDQQPDGSCISQMTEPVFQ